MKRLAVLLTAMGVRALLAQEMPHLPADKDLTAPHLDSRLARVSQGAAKVAQRVLNLEYSDDGRVVVIIEPAPGLQSSDIDIVALEEIGAEILDRSKHLLQIAIPTEGLRAAGAVRGVNFIRPPIRPVSSEVVSEGGALFAADDYHANGLTGSGVKVAVIDFGFGGADRMPAEVPTATKIVNFGAGSGASGDVHGTACAEIVHDVAPGAELSLLRVQNLLQFENAKDYAIRNEIDVVNFSAAWLGTGFGDGRGRACDVVNDAEDNGILWVNSAGNYANRQYSGLWSDADSDGWHNFSGEGELLELSDVAVGDTIEVWLTWNDWPTTTQDYDLALAWKNASGSFDIVEESNTAQRGSAPVESIEYVVRNAGSHYAVVRKAPAARGTVIKIWSANHDLEEYSDLVGNIGTPADARGSLSVGAIYHGNWTRGVIETYSSRGPTADGRIKPDLVAPAGVRTASYTGGFFGTSAAAPHVAGAAALLLAGDPALTVQELRAALVSRAVDRGVTGLDNVFGAGAILLPPPPRFDTQVHFDRSGFWETSDGTVDAKDAKWQLVSYERSSEGILVHGLLSTTVTNSTSTRLRVRLSVHFLDSADEEITTFFQPSSSPIELAPGELTTLSDIPFSAGFESLAALNELSRVALFAGFDVVLEPPTAAFVPSVTLGEAPLTVRFTNQSTGDVRTDIWSFGDGTYGGATANPSHTYAEPGTYTVLLRVSNSGGTSAASATITVTEPASQRLLARVQGSGDSPGRFRVNSLLTFLVYKYKEDDLRDTTRITDFALNVPSRLGVSSGTNRVRLGTLAGVTEAVRIVAGGLTTDYRITTLPGTTNRLVIEPSEVRIAAGRSIDFDARGEDRYGNTFNLSGVNVGWHVVPPELGTIQSRTGILSATTPGVSGYVIAVVSRSLRFGDTVAAGEGVSKVTVLNDIPQAFALLPNYPNPFNSETTIRFDLPAPAQVEVSAHNLTGQRVETLLSEHMPAGSHSIVWPAGEHPSGAYIVHLSADDMSGTQRMLLVK